MKRSTVVVLTCVVALLSALAWRQTRLDTQEALDREVPLFEGLDENQVVAVRVDNLERDDQMRFERDRAGGWMMTDPVSVRAENGIIDLIVRAAVVRTGTPVPESELDLKKLGLDPPRFVLDLEDRGGKRQKIEIGAVDLDQHRVHVKTRGRIVRALRDVETVLDLMEDDFKSHSATDLQASEVIEIHRRGAVRLEGQAGLGDVTLDALAEEGVWRATGPAEGLLDPVAISLLVHGGAGLRFDRFVDHAGASLASLGLDPAEMTLELDTLSGKRCVLRFGRRDHAEAARWNATREGESGVWEIDAGAVFLLATTIENLLDHRLTRFERSQIDAVQFSTSEREMRLEKGLFGWNVSEARPGSRVFDKALLADKSKVEDLLARLERFEYTGVELDQPFAPDEAHDTIHVRAGPTIVAGSFGAEYAPKSGGRALRFRREGETVVGLVDPDLLSIPRVRARDFWSLSVAEIAEVNALSLTISSSSATRAYTRNKLGLWVRTGGELEARELRSVLDPMLFVRAREHLGDDAQPPLEDPIRIAWTLAGDVHVEMTVAKSTVAGQPYAVVEIEGRRSVLQRQDLHAALSAILSGA